MLKTIVTLCAVPLVFGLVILALSFVQNYYHLQHQVQTAKSQQVICTVELRSGSQESHVYAGKLHTKM
jgi:cell division protein YceG involved in septum cleavage